MNHAESAPPIVVLDTNVVLDWLFFADPRCASLAAAVEGGQVRWLASPAMHDELRHVLGRGIAARSAGRPDAVFAAWERWAGIVAPWDRPSPRELRCSDADDQKFIDLALQVEASALVSRDRALLKVGRRALRHGLAIVSIADWKPG